MTGTLYTIGMGPGDPELLTVKAARLLARLPVIAHCARRDRTGHAWGIAAAYVSGQVRELRFDYPYTTEIPHGDPRYQAGMRAFYDHAARCIAAALEGGEDVGLLCEGDPFFYGSAMYLHDRLGADYPTRTIPGVTGMSGCWSRAGLPITHGDDILTVLPGTLDETALAERLAATDAAVIMKLGRNMPKVRAAIARAGLTNRAVYVERGSMAGERVLPLAEVNSDVPYFSMVLIAGRQGAR